MILNDICHISSGGTPSRSRPEFYNGKIPWAKISDIENASNGILSNTEEKISEEGLKSIGNRMFHKGTLLFAMYGSIGKVAIAGGEMATNQAILGIRPKKEKSIHLPYLRFWFEKNKQKLINQGRGVALQNLSATIIRNTHISLPSFSDQIRIANLLSTAEELISQRKESIRLLDEFLKSTFLEMFGDPVRNEKRWETRTIEQLVAKEKHSLKRGPFGGALKKEIFVSSGYLVYEQYHALNNDFSFARYYIDDEKFQELRCFEVKPGDIIISCSGVYLGKLAIVPEGAKKGIINQALLKISLDKKIINSTFFVFVFSNENFKRKFYGNYIGSGIPNFPSMDEFKKFHFIYPPFTLQNKFAQIVEKTESLKAQYKSSLKELENLYGCLSQQAFKGEISSNSNLKHL